MDDVELVMDEPELLDIGPRRQLPSWLVRAVVVVGGAGVLAAAVIAVLTPSAEGGHGSRQLPKAPTTQTQLYQPLPGHFFL